MFLRLLTSALLFSTISNAQAPVGLGRAGAYLVLAGSTVTNTGPTIVDSGGNLGVSPGTAITGFPPGQVLPPGTIHSADASAAGAQFDLVTAYNDAAGRGPATIEPTDLGGLTLVAGVYQSTPGRGPMSITTGRTLTLDAQGNPDSVWIFQTDSTLITQSSSRVMLINGAQPCNVFWQVGSSATLGTGSTFVGTIMALTSISATTNAVIQGRLLARNGQVSLDTNTITLPTCFTTTTTTTTTSTTTTSASTSATTTSVTTTTLPIITLPIIGPIGPIGPILGGGIGNTGGSITGNNKDNGNGNGSENGNGSGNDNGNGNGSENGNGSGNDNGNGSGNDNGNGNGSKNGNGSGNDNGNGNGSKNGNGSGNDNGNNNGNNNGKGKVNNNGNGNVKYNGNGAQLPTALKPYSINEHKHYHDKGHAHYGPYDDYNIAAHDQDYYGTLSTTYTTKQWETSITESTPVETEAYEDSW